MGEIARYYAAACQTDLPCLRDRWGLRIGWGCFWGWWITRSWDTEPFFDVKLVVFPEFAHAAPIY